MSNRFKTQSLVLLNVSYYAKVLTKFIEIRKFCNRKVEKCKIFSHVFSLIFISIIQVDDVFKPYKIIPLRKVISNECDAISEVWNELLNLKYFLHY